MKAATSDYYYYLTHNTGYRIYSIVKLELQYFFLMILYLARCQPKLVVVLPIPIRGRMWDRRSIHNLIPQADQVQLSAHEGDVLSHRIHHLLLLLGVLLCLLILLVDPLYGDRDGEPGDPCHLCQSRSLGT